MSKTFSQAELNSIKNWEPGIDRGNWYRPNEFMDRSAISDTFLVDRQICLEYG